MEIKINEDTMAAEANDAVIATATRTGDRWAVSTWPEPATRNQAITAMMLAVRIAAGHGDDDPLVVAWREELPRG